MKVNEFKKIEEGFFSDLARAGSKKLASAGSETMGFVGDVYRQSLGMPDNPERDKKRLSNRAAPLFTTDFIRDLNADLTSALANKAITITNLSEVAPPGAGAPPPAAPVKIETMDQYIVRWFAAYMKGVKWKEYKSKINEIAKEIASSYKKDKGKAGINKLANIAWEATSKDSEIPSGARNVSGMSNTPSTSGGKLSDKQKADLIARVQRGDADAAKEVMSMMKEGK